MCRNWICLPSRPFLLFLLLPPLLFGLLFLVSSFLPSEQLGTRAAKLCCEQGPEVKRH